MAHILVVDDHLVIRSTLQEILQEEGHLVHVEENGEDAVEVLRASTVPLVAMVDLILSGRKANPVVAALASDAALAARHCAIWMTAGSLEEAEQLTIPVRRLGVRLLIKPFDLDSLVKTVDEAVRTLHAGADHTLIVQAPGPGAAVPLG